MFKLGRSHVWIRWGLSGALPVIVAWAVGFLLFTDSLPDVAADQIPVADGIVVLTGEGERLTEAVDLLRGGAGRRLLVSGVGQGIGEASLRRVLGLSAELSGGEDMFSCCIDTGHEARDTEGNAAEIVAWARRHGYGSLCVVTASYHMPRALLEIRRRAPELRLHPYPVFPAQVVVERWWAFPGTARTLAAEYNKYLIARARASLSISDPTEGAT